MKKQLKKSIKIPGENAGRTKSCSQLEATLAAHEQERHLVGSALHENINPILATVKLYIDCAIANPEKRVSLIMDAKNFTDNAMNAIRNLSKAAIAPSIREVGLIGSLIDLIEYEKLLSKLHFITNWHSIDEKALDEQLKLTIYRIVQDQLNNISKHASAKTVIISLNQDGSLLQLNIKDDGIGFDTRLNSSGTGLKNICSRAGLFNGMVLIISAPGKGCELIVNFINEA